MQMLRKLIDDEPLTLIPESHSSYHFIFFPMCLLKGSKLSNTHS